MTFRKTALVLALAVAAWMVLVIAYNLQTQPVSRPATKTLRATYWCGETLDEAVDIGTAVNHGDIAGLTGLLARGKAFEVEEGTKIRLAGDIDFGLSRGTIDSGLQLGRTCYLSTKAVE